MQWTVVVLKLRKGVPGQTGRTRLWSSRSLLGSTREEWKRLSLRSKVEALEFPSLSQTGNAADCTTVTTMLDRSRTVGDSSGTSARPPAIASVRVLSCARRPVLEGAYTYGRAARRKPKEASDCRCRTVETHCTKRSPGVAEAYMRLTRPTALLFSNGRTH